MGLQPLLPVAICNPAGEPVVCEHALIDTGASVSGLPRRLMGPLGIVDEMCFDEPVGGVQTAERVPLPRLGFSIETHCVGRRTLIRPIFNAHAERAWLGIDFLQHWRLEWEGWTGPYVGLWPHPDLPHVQRQVQTEDDLQRQLAALGAP